jgi:nitrate reductase NapD
MLALKAACPLTGKPAANLECIDSMNISSVLVNASSELLQQVQKDLAALTGVEVHATTEEGRLIVTIEADSDRAVANMFEEINHLPGVLSASMVYHQYEPDPDEEA